MSSLVKGRVRWIVWTVVVVAMVLGFCWALISWSFTSSPIDLDDVHMISPGVSMSEVEGLLGEPSSFAKRIDTCTLTWIYSHPLKYHKFWVYFSSDGTVIRTAFQDIGDYP